MLAIGPDRAGNLLEVILLELADDRLLAIHAMAMRPTFTSYFRRGMTFMADEPNTYRTRTGRVLTDAEIEALADEAERDYDVEQLKGRRRGRPLLGAAPAGVVAVRLDPDLKAAVEGRAASEHTSASEIIRRALYRYLYVA